MDSTARTTTINLRCNAFELAMIDAVAKDIQDAREGTDSVTRADAIRIAILRTMEARNLSTAAVQV